MNEGERDGDSEEPGPEGPSWGNMGPGHWSVKRRGTNQEALEHYHRRSQAPGVAEGGGSRNHYCMECKGVLPLAYDQREPASEEVAHCPHCGAQLDPRVREMFNWVEIDQPPRSDAAALAPLFLIALLAVAAVLYLALRLLR